MHAFADRRGDGFIYYVLSGEGGHVAKHRQRIQRDEGSPSNAATKRSLCHRPRSYWPCDTKLRRGGFGHLNALLLQRQGGRVWRGRLLNGVVGGSAAREFVATISVIARKNPSALRARRRIWGAGVARRPISERGEARRRVWRARP